MKQLLSLGFALATVFALTGAADAAKTKVEKKAHTVAGVVKHIKAPTAQDPGKLTLEVKEKGKKGETAEKGETEARHFEITADTKVELVTGKKGSTTTTAGKLSNITAGEMVHVTVEDGKVLEIKLHEKKKS